MPERSPFTLHAAVSSTGAIITLTGELDVTNAYAMGRALNRALAPLLQTPRPSLVLHMAGVEFLDVAAARAIVTAVQAWPGPRPVVIRDPTLIVRRLLQVSGLTDDVCLAETPADPASPSAPARPSSPAPARINGEISFHPEGVAAGD